MGKYSALILCDGEPPGEALFRHHLKAAGLFVVTDGAAAAAMRFGVEPHAVIGDMDAFIPPPDYKPPVIQDPDQETNDLEKALGYLLKQNIRSVVVLGATGRRLDHTLKNLSVLKQYNEKFDSLVFEDEYVNIILLPREYSRQTEAGVPISLFPLSGKVTGITTRGLRYGLNNESLENGVRDGSSNETTGSLLHIRHQTGDLLMLTAKHPGKKIPLT